MKIKFLSMLILVFTTITIGCSNNEIENDNISSDVKTSDKFSLLNSSKDVIESSEQYSQAKAFIPDEDYIEYQNVKDAKFSYIKLPENKTIISGKIILENNTEETMKIQSFFMQGNKIAEVKTRSSEKWEKSISYDVQPKSSVEINVDIFWDKDGIDELTFFPLDHTSTIDRYNGGNLSTFRYFVLDDDIVINNDMLTTQSFKLDSEEKIDDPNFFPIPYWIGNDNKEVEYVVEQEKLLTKNPISGLKLDPVPYGTEIDVLLMDELGNLSVLLEKVKVKKNEPTFIHLNSDILNKLRKSQNKNYVILLNNRGVDILLDMKALDLGLKPFSTTYQSVIEFYKESN